MVGLCFTKVCVKSNLQNSKCLTNTNVKLTPTFAAVTCHVNHTAILPPVDDCLPGLWLAAANICGHSAITGAYPRGECMYGRIYPTGPPSLCLVNKSEWYFTSDPGHFYLGDPAFSTLVNVKPRDQLFGLRKAGLFPCFGVGVSLSVYTGCLSAPLSLRHAGLYDELLLCVWAWGTWAELGDKNKIPYCDKLP